MLISIIIIYQIFGGFVSEEFRIYSQFYGNNETFLFTFYDGDYILSYGSTGKNDFYIYSDSDLIALGCS